MRPNMLIIIPVALVMATGSGLAIRHYVKSAVDVKPDPVVEAPKPVVEAPKPPPAPVFDRALILVKDVVPGTPVSASDVKWVNWPSNMISTIRQQGGIVVRNEREEKSAIRSIIGSIYRTPMYKGDLILPARLIFPTDKGSTLSFILRPGYRPFSMALNPLTASGSMIQPGDHVDVVLSMNVPPSMHNKPTGIADQMFPSMVTQTILENQNVLAIDHNFVTTKQRTEPHMVTLEMTPRNVERMITAQRMGTVYLELRPFAAGKDASSTKMMTDIQVIPELRAAKMHKSVKDVNAMDPFEEASDPEKTKNPITNVMVYEGSLNVRNVGIEDGHAVDDPQYGMTVVRGDAQSGAGGVSAGGAANPLNQVAGATGGLPGSGGNSQAQQQNNQNGNSSQNKEAETPYVPFVSHAYVQKFVKGGR